MAFDFEGISNAIFRNLLQLNLDKNNDEQEELVPKAMYEISKQPSKGTKKCNNK